MHGGQAFDLLGQALAVRASRASTMRRMEDPPALLGQAAVGHLVGQGVLEGEFTLGEEPRLVDELGLQVVEAAVQAASGISAMACNSARGTSVPMTAAVWKRCLSSGGSRSIRAASTACTVAGT